MQFFLTASYADESVIATSSATQVFCTSTVLVGLPELLEQIIS